MLVHTLGGGWHTLGGWHRKGAVRGTRQLRCLLVVIIHEAYAFADWRRCWHISAATVCRLCTKWHLLRALALHSLVAHHGHECAWLSRLYYCEFDGFIRWLKWLLFITIYSSTGDCNSFYLFDVRDIFMEGRQRILFYAAGTRAVGRVDRICLQFPWRSSSTRFYGGHDICPHGIHLQCETNRCWRRNGWKRVRKYVYSGEMCQFLGLACCQFNATSSAVNRLAGTFVCRKCHIHQKRWGCVEWNHFE